MAKKLSASEKTALNSQINLTNKNSANEIAILIIPSLDGEAISDISHTVFNTWKVGKAGLDNGVLITISVKDRKTRIETGKGVEGDLTDLQSNDIIKNNLNPYLKKNDFYHGLSETVDVISKTIESRKKIKPVTPMPAPVSTQPVQKDIPRVNDAGCSSSGNEINSGDIIMFILFFVAVAIGIVLWKVVKFTDRVWHGVKPSNDYDEEKMIGISPKRYTPAPEAPIRTNYSIYNYPPSPPPEKTYSGTPVKSYSAPVSYKRDPEPVTEEIDNSFAYAAAPIITSFFSKDDSVPERTYFEEEPRYTSSDNSSNDDTSSDTGFGGGESAGGGSESNWDD